MAPTMAPTMERTHYSGIYIVHEYGYYWISDDNGGEGYYGTTRPTRADVDAYRDEACPV